MALTRRSHGAAARSSRDAFALAAVLVLFLAALLLPNAPALAATRLHHASAMQSAGAAPGKVTAGKHTVDNSQRADKSHSRAASRPRPPIAAHSGKSPGIGARHSVPADSRTGKATGKRHKQREPERVDDPILLDRASAHGRATGRGRRARVLKARGNAANHPAAHPRLASQPPALAKPRAVPAPRASAEAGQQPAPDHHVVTPERSARERRLAHEAEPLPAATSPVGPDDKPLTTDDFLRAAGAVQASSKAGETASSEGFQHGQSHPDDDESLPADLPKASGLVSQKPAQILRASRADTAETIQGFGAELDVLTPRTAAHTSGWTRLNPAEGLTPEAKREITEEAVQPVMVPLYSRNGKLNMPAPLKGSHEILVHQNLMADNAGLTRIQDDDDLNHMRAQHLLVGFPDIASLDVNPELPANRRYARPWTVKFVTDTARLYYAKFHEPLRLNSAVRTVNYQLRLQRVNGNAAAVDGDGASPHLTGQAIDLGKRGMTSAQLAWMRLYLAPLIDAGKVDVEEEFQQACFHISVYTSYLPKVRKALRVDVAQLK